MGWSQAVQRIKRGRALKRRVGCRVGFRREDRARLGSVLGIEGHSLIVALGQIQHCAKVVHVLSGGLFRLADEW